VPQGVGVERRRRGTGGHRLGHAERIASSIISEPQKASALRQVAKALAAIDPGRAERIANSITEEYV
jgi:hypothetical protein